MSILTQGQRAHNLRETRHPFNDNHIKWPDDRGLFFIFPQNARTESQRVKKKKKKRIIIQRHHNPIKHRPRFVESRRHTTGLSVTFIFQVENWILRNSLISQSQNIYKKKKKKSKEKEINISKLLYLPTKIADSQM